MKLVKKFFLFSLSLVPCLLLLVCGEVRVPPEKDVVTPKKCTEDKECKSDKECLSGVCNLDKNICEFKTKQNYCYVNGTCYLKGVNKPDDKCYVCDPDSTQNDFVKKKCEEGKVCNPKTGECEKIEEEVIDIVDVKEEEVEVPPDVVDIKEDKVDVPPDVPPDIKEEEVKPECNKNEDCKEILTDIKPCEGAVCADGKCIKIQLPEGSVCKNPDILPKEAQCFNYTCNKDGECIGEPKVSAPCNDENPCTDEDFCINGQCVGKEKKCDDENPCTKDFCENGNCKSENYKEKVDCEDGNPCTKGDYCKEGVCVAGTNICQCQTNKDCQDDGNLCNGIPICLNNKCVIDEKTIVNCDTSKDDQCNKTECIPESGNCEKKTLYGETCDDKILCTENDKCDINGICKGTEKVCDDNNLCTNDKCVDGECKYEPNSIKCDDGIYCTVNDICSNKVCAGNPDDNICGLSTPCVTYKCVVAEKGCKKIFNNGATCEDGNKCTVGDKCDYEGNCIPGKNICECQKNEDCKDDNLCDGKMICKDNKCVNDGNVVKCEPSTKPCMENKCNPPTGICIEVPADDGKECDLDSNKCTIDKCKSGKCLNVEYVKCDDGISCTDDSCNKTDGKCVYIPNNTKCNDNNPCSKDICDVTKGCTYDFASLNYTQCDDGSDTTIGDMCILKKCRGFVYKNFLLPTICGASDGSLNILTTTYNKVTGIYNYKTEQFICSGSPLVCKCQNKTSYSSIVELKKSDNPVFMSGGYAKAGTFFRDIDGYAAVGDEGQVAYYDSSNNKWSLKDLNDAISKVGGGTFYSVWNGFTGVAPLTISNIIIGGRKTDNTNGIIYTCSNSKSWSCSSKTFPYSQYAYPWSIYGDIDLIKKCTGLPPICTFSYSIDKIFILSNMDVEGKNHFHIYHGDENFYFTIGLDSSKITDGAFNKIYGTEDNNVWAVGNNGLVYHFDGTNWKQITGVPTSSDYNYKSVWIGLDTVWLLVYYSTGKVPYITSGYRLYLHPTSGDYNKDWKYIDIHKWGGLIIGSIQINAINGYGNDLYMGGSYWSGIIDSTPYARVYYMDVTQ